MKKVKVFSTQFNFQYGSVIHFPYSIASLVAYIKSFSNLDSQYQFEKTFVFRNKFDEYLSRCEDVDILLCSCYSWNWEITTRLAKKVKEKNPNCTIIFGGPQVPLVYKGDVPLTWVEDSKGKFFSDYPYVDILVHQEGEYTLKNIFDEYLNNKDYSEIQGLETKTHRTLAADRILDLDTLPSPYLSNLVWDLVEEVEGVNYIASWETNRGCPYQCTYCDWGSATKAKVRKRDMDILFKEIEWFADNKISYLDCCDANFGIFSQRDLALSEKLKTEKLSKGFPGRVRPAWAKASTKKIIPIAKELLDADLLRSVTLAVQSFDEQTLNTVRRSNIKFDKFSNLVQQFTDNKIETYTEIIMGLPGATLTSYLDGLEILMELFPRPAVFVYNCGVFVNAPMNDTSYIEEHGIGVIKSPIYLWHSSIYNRGDIPEYEYITVSTNTFSLDDLKQMFLYGWVTQVFHSQGILEYVSKFYNQIFGVKYIDFYKMFIQHCAKSKSSKFGKEYQILLDHVDAGYSGGGWDHHDPDLAPIFWPIEEATWLRCARDSRLLITEIIDFTKHLAAEHDFKIDSAIAEDLANFQVFILSTMDNKDAIKTQSFKYDWKNFLSNNSGSLKELSVSAKSYSWANKVTESDTAQWCYKAIWVGRNQGNYKCHLEDLQDEPLLLDS